MKNKVSVTQIALLILLVISGGKFLSLPSILAAEVGHDAWIVLCINFLLDVVCLIALLWAVKLNANNLSFDEILNKTVTKVGSKIVLTIFFVMFVGRSIILLDSCYKTLAVTFDVNTNWLLFVAPILVVAYFAVRWGFNSIARVSQILFALVVLSIIAILIYPTTKAQFSQLLPLFEAGTKNLFKTAFLRSFWFSDYVFVYFVLENIKPQKHVIAPILTSFFVGAALTVLLNAVFLALFGDLAQFGTLAMSKIGLFSATASSNGRWDWLTLSAWLMSVVIKVIIFVFCAYKCVEKVFEKHFSCPNLVVFGVIGVLLLLPLVVSVDVFMNEFLAKCVFVFAAVQYVLPLAMPLLTKLANKSVDKHSQTLSEAKNAQS